MESPRRFVNARSEVHQAGDWGKAWRVTSGAVRLDMHHDSQTELAGIALPGDVVGAEVMELGAYAMTAKAIIPTTLVALPPPKQELRGQATAVTAIEHHRKAAALLALRSGTADGRIIRLVRLLTLGQGMTDPCHTLGPVYLPYLKDMAEITDLTMESVSRTVSKLRRAGILRYDTNNKKLVTIHLQPAQVSAA